MSADVLEQEQTAKIQIEDSKATEGLEPFLTLASDGIEVSFYDDEHSGRFLVNVQFSEDDERWSELTDPEMLKSFVGEVFNRLVAAAGELKEGTEEITLNLGTTEDS